MAYAVVRDVSASWEQYECLAAAISEPAPAGLIFHVAGPTDEGFRTIDLWASERAWETFRNSRLREEASAPSASLGPRSTLRDLRPINIVLGADLSSVAPAPSDLEEEQ